MHLEMTKEKEATQIDAGRYVVHGVDGVAAQMTGPVIGKVVKRGAADDDHERRYLIVDGIDGHSHYVDIGTSTEPTPVDAMVSLTPRQAEPRAVERTVIPIAQAHSGRQGLRIHHNHDHPPSQASVENPLVRLEPHTQANQNP